MPARGGNLRFKTADRMQARIAAIIPARGGSKGIPRKNVRSLAGKPMIAYIIEAARRVSALDRVIVSTDDHEIAVVAERAGAEVPFLRPPELAADEVPTLPVLQHALGFLREREGYVPDYVLLVYPTSPLLTAERIAEAVQIALKTGADSVVSGTLDRGHYWRQTEDGAFERFYPLRPENRQLSVPLFRENGAIYLTKTPMLGSQVAAGKMMPLIMDPDESVDVDEPADWARVEERLLRVVAPTPRGRAV